MDDNPQARKEAMDVIRKGKRAWCKPLPDSSFQHLEQLVNKGKHTIERLGELYLHDPGCRNGSRLSAHMPELVVYSDLNEYDVQTYIQIYNCMGFMMQVGDRNSQPDHS